MTGPDLAELRRLAEAATPGPWYGVDELSLLIENERATEDIPYIAAANPAGVLALLAERDALAAKVERVRALHAIAYCGDSTCEHCPCSTCPPRLGWPCPTVRALDEEPLP